MPSSLLSPRGRARLAAGVFLFSIVGFMAPGCFLQAASDRSSCDDALGAVCGCGSIDCDAADAPPIVAALRACDMDALRDDLGFDLPVCITGSRGYCGVLGGVIRHEPTLCEIPCEQESACDLEAACHQFQFESCDLATSTGGSGK